MDVVGTIGSLKEAVDAQKLAWKNAQGITSSSYDGLIESINGFKTGACDAIILDLKSEDATNPDGIFIDIINRAIKNTKSVIDDKNGEYGYYTFSDTDITYFNGGIFSTGEGSFNKCSFLIAAYGVNIESCTSAEKMFYGCSILKRILFDGSLSAVTNASQMFYNCSNLTSLTFPDGSLSALTNASDMFAYCEKLTSLTFPDGSLSKVTNAYYMFAYCESLTSVTFPEGSLTALKGAYYMFYHCESLTSVTFPEGSLTALKGASSMFSNCSKLTSVTFPDGSLTALTNAQWMFASTNLASLTFPDGSLSAVTNAYYMFYNCSKLTEINGTINLANATEIQYFANNSAIPEIKLAEMRDTINWSIVKHASGHFYGDKYVKTFSHPETTSLTTAKEMFRASQMETIDIDLSNLTGVASYIFYSSKILTSVTFHGGIGDVANVERLFSDCTALTTITGLSFKSVTCISLNMFLNCTALTDCKYEGTLYMSGISLSPCTNLSAESLYSWVSALYDWKTNSEGKTTTSTSHVLTLSESQIESLRSYTGDNGESGESAYLLALEKGWDITS